MFLVHEGCGNNSWVWIQWEKFKRDSVYHWREVTFCRKFHNFNNQNGMDSIEWQLRAGKRAAVRKNLSEVRWRWLNLELIQQYSGTKAVNLYELLASFGIGLLSDAWAEYFNNTNEDYAFGLLLSAWAECFNDPKEDFCSICDDIELACAHAARSWNSRSQRRMFAWAIDIHVVSVHGRWQGWSRTYLWGFSCFSCVSEFISPEHITFFSLPATSIAKKQMLIGLPIINCRHIKDRDNNGSLKYWVSGTGCRWKKFLAQIYQSFRSHVQLSPWGQGACRPGGNDMSEGVNGINRATVHTCKSFNKYQ